VSRTARVDPDAMRTSALDDGIVQIRLPMRGNPMRYINAYAVDEGAAGLSLVDCGWKTGDVRAALDEGLAAFGARVGDIRRLFITHFHFDHYGLAATLMRAGVPELFMHARDWETVRGIFEDPDAAERASDEWLARNGFTVPPSSDDDPYRRLGELVVPTKFVADGELRGRLEAVFTPGHSPGHVCFRDVRTGRLFTGDHILDPVTPHVGLWFEGRGDPLGEYVESLHKVARLGATGALPAHGEPFDDLGRRIGELLAHTERRETAILGTLEAGPRTAGQIAQTLAWTRRDVPFEELDEMHQQFAVAETLAHLEYAFARGRVVRDEMAQPIVYARASMGTA
jgi:glyoxylase-like metal-dependent hydrolase (beta-lactamase superfamily II)